MRLRPYGIVLDGRLELGLEVELEHGRITHLGPQTGMPDPYVLSTAFVNAHSHLEYRGMLGKMPSGEYWPWIREITRLKPLQTPEEVAHDCLVAARENLATGVAAIGEHSDRPCSGAALAKVPLRGVIFQEVITSYMMDTRTERLTEIKANAEINRASFDGQVLLSPHTAFTVDHLTLAEIGASGQLFSIHVAETPLESQFTRDGSGPLGQGDRPSAIGFKPHGKSIVGTLDELGLVRKGAQFVHCCAIEPEDPALLAERGVTVAHCPRSNITLGCPIAPVRELLDAGVIVGLGLDSAASSGPIDLFAEMRAALEVSRFRGRPLLAEEVWRMATEMGARSIPGLDLPPWHIAVGESPPLIALDIPGALTVEDLIEQGSSNSVRWIA